MSKPASPTPPVRQPGPSPARHRVGFLADFQSLGSSLLEHAEQARTIAKAAPIRAVLDVAAVKPYLDYYLAFQATKGINELGAKGGKVGSVISHVAAALLVPLEARGLAGDVLLDLSKDESVRDEQEPGSIDPLHSFLPRWLQIPLVQLPGVGEHSVDFGW